LHTRCVSFIGALGPEIKAIDGGAKAVDEDDPFSAPSARSAAPTGADQPAKDSFQAAQPALAVLADRVLSGIQWHATEVR
jgi:hypothetical protein